MPADSGEFERALEAAAALLDDCRIAVITGAGISTDSGIPDYRGSGTALRSRIDFEQFVAHHEVRQRYWLRAYFGWDRFSSAAPNEGHLAVTAMGQAGTLSGVITQNVDGLHRDAGSDHVVELHGNLARLLCLRCGQKFDRQAFHERFIALNTWLSASTDIDQAPLGPDGDASIDVIREVTVPVCTVCGGTLKPDVVFFGEFIPPRVFAAASNIVKRANALIIAGSSLTVNSPVRLIESARRKRLPIVIINRGPTKADRLATVRIEGSCSSALSGIASRLGATNLLEDIE